MNRDQGQGSWNQVQGKAKQRGGDLTDDELDTIARDELIGRLHQAWYQQGENPGTGGQRDRKAIHAS